MKMVDLVNAIKGLQGGEPVKLLDVSTGLKYDVRLVNNTTHELEFNSAIIRPLDEFDVGFDPMVDKKTDENWDNSN